LKLVREGGDREFKEIPDSRRADEKRCDSHRGKLSKILVEGEENSCDHIRDSMLLNIERVFRSLFPIQYISIFSS
jgi:hypothetical protein